jgi:hypothetical protein
MCEEVIAPNLGMYEALEEQDLEEHEYYESLQKENKQTSDWNMNCGS